MQFDKKWKHVSIVTSPTLHVGPSHTPPVQIMLKTLPSFFATDRGLNIKLLGYLRRLNPLDAHTLRQDATIRPLYVATSLGRDVG
jgi:hypothetical protein